MGDLDSAAVASTEGATGLWIRRFHPAPDAPVRMICLPHAGGSATYYLPVARALAPAVDVLAVQYPGRQDRMREPCVDSLHELADRVAEQVRPWTGVPIALFGHSMGATLGYEVAKRLERDGAGPLVLFASGRRAPSTHRDGEVMYLRPDEDLLDDLRAMSGTDSRVFADESLLRLVLPALRSDYKATETYRHTPGAGPELACPIVALVGDSDPKATVEEARAWDTHTTAGFDLRVFDGGHFFLNDHAPAVIELIAERLAGLRGLAAPGGRC
ncbi:thioesterase II family protein [Streptomyces sp. NPDC048473]|uniref:thioesterase II family protein n=1 Tax=unclassified Streptomyces TaxID=2593676 RepID=UPI00371DD128